MHIGIAGAGLIGRLLAYTLLLEGYKITLFDKEARKHSTCCGIVAGAMLSPFSEIETTDTQHLKMGLESLELWSDLCYKLNMHHLLQQKGSLLTAHPQDWPELTRFMTILQTRARDFFSAEHIQLLGQQELRELIPDLSKIQRAYYLPLEAHISTDKFFSAIAEEIAQLGGHWFEKIHVIDVDNNTIQCTNERYPFDFVFDCRGLGAKSKIKQLRGVRGELMLLEAKEVTINTPIRLFHPRYKVYLVPQGDHLYKLGATEIESDDHSPISVRSALELLTALYSIIPEFAEARIIETLTQCRPALPNNLPMVEVKDGLGQINGLYRHGYLFAPKLVQQAIEGLKQLGA